VIELQKSDSLALVAAAGHPLTKVRMCVGWDKNPTAGAIGTGAPDIDLDASAVQFANGELFDLAFYNNLRTRDGSTVHLGDNKTGSGAGDDEVIAVDLRRVYAHVDTIMFMVSSYHGHTLEWVHNAYCRLLDVEADDGADHELARFTLSLGVPQTGIAMAKLVRTDPGWSLHAIGEGIDATVPTQAVPALRRFL
jgi:tellurium resistance protein TerZ